MKKGIFILLCFLSVATAFAGSGGHKRKVLIITITGARPDAVVAANAPNIDALVAGGFYTYDSWSQEKTVQAPAMSSMFTGVYNPKHGVTNNTFSGSDFNTYPYFPTRAKQVDNTFKCVQRVEWSPLSDFVYNDGWDVKDIGPDGNTSQTGTDAVALIQDQNTDLLHIHFDAVDLAGHSYQFSPSNNNYLAAIQDVDAQIGNIINAMRNRPTYSQEDWLVFVVTDHGGTGTGHGGNSYEERRLFWIAYSDRGTPQRISGPQNGSFTNPADPGTYATASSVNTVLQKQSPVLVDVATTALHHLIYNSGIVPDNYPAWNLDGKSWLCQIGLCDPPIVATITTPGNTTICQGESVVLSASIDTSYSYQWYRNGQLLNGAVGQTYTASQSGSYTVRVYTNVQADTSGAVQVVVNPNPTVSAAISPSDSVCQGTQVTLSAVGANSYVWTNGVVSGVPFAANNSATYIVAGTGANGCIGYDTIHLVAVPYPLSQAITGPTSITPSQTYLYSVTNSSGFSYNWNVTGGTIQNGQGTSSVNITWNATGPYGIQLTQTNSLGCNASSTISIISNGGGCSITYSLNQVGNINPLCLGDTVLLIVQGPAGSSFQWLENGNNIGNGNDTLVVTNSGQYQVRIDSANCSALSNSISLTFQPLPIQPVIQINGQTGVCGAQPTLYLVNPYNTYAWSNGANTASVIPTQSGNYTVTVTNAAGCSTASAPVSINLSVVPQYDICIVSVDSASGKNILVWEKQNLGAIDSFYLYKEGNQLNVFNKIGAVAVNGFSTFIDQSSNPQLQADRYTIAVYDTCGNVSIQSAPQQTIHLTSNLGVGGVINLLWNEYVGFTYPSFDIYRGTSAGNLQLLTTLAASSTSFTDANPPTGQVYYQVGITNPNGCSPSKSTGYSSSLSNKISVNTVGINESTTDAFKVYPNPASNVMVIASTVSPFKVSTYQLRDITGKLILQGELHSELTQVALEGLSSGLYFLHIEGHAYKIVKE
ncbi:MAG: alkaline phosphatase family protein [Chitinophagales bacterium]|nr:alkaline phosphatase family protein [Chitinophagales bacterium]